MRLRRKPSAEPIIFLVIVFPPQDFAVYIYRPFCSKYYKSRCYLALDAARIDSFEELLKDKKIQHSPGTLIHITLFVLSLILQFFGHKKYSCKKDHVDNTTNKHNSQQKR